MTLAKRIIATMIGAFLLLAAPTAAAPGTTGGDGAPAATVSSKNVFFNSWGTCRNAKPFKPPKRHCRYDRAKWFRSTFVLKSKVGKVTMKACFRIFSRPPLGGRHACGQSRMPLKYKAFPFWVRGARQAFKVRILWYARGIGSNKFGKVGVSWMRVRP